MDIIKRDGTKEPLDIKKIQKYTSGSTDGLDGVNQSELELDAHIQFVENMQSHDIQNTLIKTAVDKIDIDRPNWTYVAARLFLYDLYHWVGKTVNGQKGAAYCHLKDYIALGKKEGRLVTNLDEGYDIEDLNNYIKPERDLLFNYLGIKTLFDRYLIKNSQGFPIELPQQMFMSISMFLAQNEKNKQEKAKEFYDVLSQFEVMLATPTLSNARTNRHQLSSCYIGASPDNIEGIFDGYKEMGLLSKFGGGIGWDWHNIRAIGGSIDNHQKASGGTVPFLKITNDIALAVDQLGCVARDSLVKIIDSVEIDGIAYKLDNDGFITTNDGIKYNINEIYKGQSIK
jgi:ribonucleoside-diphosphate reductase alpha chain